jgi:hypothetical protein
MSSRPALATQGDPISETKKNKKQNNNNKKKKLSDPSGQICAKAITSKMNSNFSTVQFSNLTIKNKRKNKQQKQSLFCCTLTFYVCLFLIISARPYLIFLLKEISYLLWNISILTKYFLLLKYVDVTVNIIK